MSKEKRLIILGWFIFVVYLTIFLKLAVFRPDFPEHPLFAHGSVHLIPFEYYIWLLGHHRYSYFVYLFVGNIAWFMPFGFFIPYLTKRAAKLPIIMLYGFLLSLLVEFCQYAFGTGESELDDLILNTLGTAAGFLILRRCRRLTQIRHSGSKD